MPYWAVSIGNSKTKIELNLLPMYIIAAKLSTIRLFCE